MSTSVPLCCPPPTVALWVVEFEKLAGFSMFVETSAPMADFAYAHNEDPGWLEIWPQLGQHCTPGETTTKMSDVMADVPRVDLMSVYGMLQALAQHFCSGEAVAQILQLIPKRPATGLTPYMTSSDAGAILHRLGKGRALAQIPQLPVALRVPTYFEFPP